MASRSPQFATSIALGDDMNCNDLIREAERTIIYRAGTSGSPVASPSVLMGKLFLQTPNSADKAE